MTPAEAIRKECKYCMNEERFNPAICGSKECKLRDKSIISPLRRIKAHCLDCADSYENVKACDGLLLPSEKCHLHAYRFGTNPQLKRQLTNEQKEKLRERGRQALKDYRLAQR